jgi:hypothetical protein
MDEATQARLREFIPIAGTSVNNPIDTNAGPEMMDRTLRIVAAARDVDAVFTNPPLGRWPGGGPPGGPPGGPAGAGVDEVSRAEADRQLIASAGTAAEDLARLQLETGKPFVALQRERGMGATSVEVSEAFQQAAYRAGVAAFPTIHRAARAIGLLLTWRAQRAGLPDVI